MSIRDATQDGVTLAAIDAVTITYPDDTPQSLWWLSFADRAFRGAYLCVAPSALAAHIQCGLDGCNPGGEMLALEIPGDVPPALQPFLRRLLTKSDCIDLDRCMGGDGSLVKPTDLDDDGEPIVERPS